jgi:large subunit ribosomal protein L6
LVVSKTVERIIEIPPEVDLEISGRTVKMKGPRGTLTEDLSHLPINLTLQDKRLTVEVAWPRKREYAMAGTAAAHIRNMIKGVTKGFTYKLKLVHSHFPINVKVKEDKKVLLIENFTGEKSPRTVKLVGDVSVKVAQDDIIVQGTNLNDVSQTAANIEHGTKIKDKDQRVFLDGIYIFEKA